MAVQEAGSVGATSRGVMSVVALLPNPAVSSAAIASAESLIAVCGLFNLQSQAQCTSPPVGCSNTDYSNFGLEIKSGFNEIKKISEFDFAIDKLPSSLSFIIGY